MEEKSNMTAERSLEIISEQIAQTRHAVSKITGEALYVAGLCTMATAVVIAIINSVSETPFGNLLWLLLPVVIKQSSRNIYKTPAPESLIGTLVGKTWLTFAVFSLTYFVIAHIWNFVMIRFYSQMPASQLPISMVIVLFMGMAVTITGYILKKKWLVWAGIVGGLAIAACCMIGLITWLLITCGVSMHTIAIIQISSYCLYIFLFAFVGLMLPGLMLKKQCV